jgi:hypothetical protein
MSDDGPKSAKVNDKAAKAEEKEASEVASTA